MSEQNFSGFQKDAIAVNDQLEDFDGSARMVDALSVGKPELPAMPRTSQLAIFERSFGERPGLVRTYAGQRGKAAARVGNTDWDGAKEKFAGLAFGWKVSDGGNARKLAHCCKITWKAR